MKGNMMQLPLTIPSILEFAAARHGDTEIVSCHGRAKRRSTYRATLSRVHRLANALLHLGIRKGDMIGTLAFNDLRHLELYYAIPYVGAICHTINPRLAAADLRYIVEHAGDKLLFVDQRLKPVLTEAVPDFPSERIVVLEEEPETSSGLRYEHLVASSLEDTPTIQIDENDASGLCYTSGTTGRPKGVLYSHRSTVLFALTMCTANSTAVSALDTVMPAVPMFHVNAWGMPHAAPMAGSKLVLPGADLSGAHLGRLFNEENVSLAIGVPTIWNNLLLHLEQSGDILPKGVRLGVGGSAPSRKMVDDFEDRYGVTMLQGWGMTETSPTGAAGIAHHATSALSRKEKRDLTHKQGHSLWGVEMRLIDDDGKEVASDDMGRLQVRGHWVVERYFNDADTSSFTDGWFDTGDIATLDPRGFLTLTDRAKDIIKSGGEWISSVTLENIAQSHPAVADAAAIAVPDATWQERPFLVVVLKPGCSASVEDILSLYEGAVPKWWKPDGVMFAQGLPRNATGKVLKRDLRQSLSPASAKSQSAGGDSEKAS